MAGFDLIFEMEGIEVIHTPFQAPKACFVPSVRDECLGLLLILGESHLRRILKEYVLYYNARWPHQGLVQQCPVPLTPAFQNGVAHRHDCLGGIIRDYGRAAA